jgi:hypothetical protein
MGFGAESMEWSFDGTSREPQAGAYRREVGA